MADALHSPPTGPDSGVVVVGRILAPYGVQGWVHLAAFTDPKENLLDYQPWLLSPHENGPWQRAEVLKVRAHRQGFVALLDGVGDRDAAERLRGRLIGVPESALPVTESDEYYWRDLIGAAVVDVTGRVLGHVASLLETGAHDVLVVRRADDGTDAGTDSDRDGAELLIPFHARYVLGVDRETATIRVDWQDEAD